jgi:hypothetical protein
MSRKRYWEMMESIEDGAIDLSVSLPYQIPSSHINCEEMGFPMDFQWFSIIKIL